MENKKCLGLYRASAGSGKTFRLAVEFISLLVNDPTAYQHILAVTFTNKATGEMKQRILGQLYGIANGLQSSEKYVVEIKKLTNTADDSFIRERAAMALRAILHDFSNFHIVTIDSFFQSIVRELANELGLAANISVELNADAVLRQAVDEIIDNLSVTSPEYDSLVRYIQARFDDDKSWKIDETVAEFGKNLLNEHFLIHDTATRSAISDKGNLDDYRDKLNAFRTARMERLGNVIECERTAALSALQATGCESGFVSHAVKMLTQDWNTLDKWRDTYDKYLETPLSWTKKALAGNEAVMTVIASTIMPCLARLKAAFGERAKLQNDTDAALQHLYNLMIVGKISEQIDTINKDRNRFLLAETAHFLRDVINESNLPFIYEKTGTVIRHIMIDEFQDTSTLQWHNFKPLLAECLDAGNNCLIVGDVKQSIYRFRNSDWQVLNNIDGKGSDMSGYVAHIRHDVNHRSSPVVVDFNNRFFTNTAAWAQKEYSESLGERCKALSIAYENVSQKWTADDRHGYVRIDCIRTPDDSGSKPDFDALQLERLRCNIAALLKEGVKQDDITILVRKGRHAADICKDFEERKDELGVNIVSSEAFRLDASSAVNIIIYVLRSLSALTDRMHLATLAYYYQTLVLRNEAVSDDLSLPLLATDDELALNYLPKDFTERRAEMRFKPIAEIAEEAYEIFQLSRLEGQDSYMLFFHDIIEKYSQDNLADIDSFLKMWDDELHEKTVPSSKASGIRIMTIHKSKGLEFHTVIVPYCNWSLDPSDNTLLWHTPKQRSDAGTGFPLLPLMPVNYSKTKNSDIFRENHDEEMLLTLVDNINVLYVAFTRASQNLVIITDERRPGRSNDSHGVSNLVKAAIQDIDLAMEADDMADTYTAGQIVTEVDENSDEETEPQDINPLTRRYDAQEIEFVSEKTLAEFRQSNNSDMFIAEQSPDESQRQHADRMRLINLGNLYHNILQSVNTVDDLHSAVQRMDSRGCFDRLSDKTMTEQRLRALIGGVSETHPEWFSPDWKPINERAILFTDSERGNGSCCTKRPDRVVTKGEQAIVIDYKTALEAVVRKADGSIDVPSKNRNQVKLYCSLMRQLGYKQVKGFLWYLLDETVYEVE